MIDIHRYNSCKKKKKNKTFVSSDHKEAENDHKKWKAKSILRSGKKLVNNFLATKKVVSKLSLYEC